MFIIVFTFGQSIVTVPVLGKFKTQIVFYLQGSQCMTFSLGLSNCSSCLRTAKTLFFPHLQACESVVGLFSLLLITDLLPLAVSRTPEP